MASGLSSVLKSNSSVGIVLFGVFAAQGVVRSVITRSLSTVESPTARKKSPLYTRTGDKGTSSVSLDTCIGIIVISSSCTMENVDLRMI